MNLYFDSEPINQAPISAEYTDYASGRCDSLELTFNDDEGEIRNRQITKGMEIQAIAQGCDSGVMYVSDIKYHGNNIMLRAVSMPLKCFRSKNQYWDHISFNELVKDITKETELNARILNELTAHYIDVTRLEMNPIKFLTSRIILEGFQCKVYDGSIIIYDERIQEQKEVEQIVSMSDFNGEMSFSTSDSGLISRIENKYKNIHTIVDSGIDGKILRTNLGVSTIGESERFSKGLMREANKYEFTASGNMDGLQYRAGQNIWLSDAPYGHDGQNYIYAVKNDLIHEKQQLLMRKGINGDY